MIEPQEQESVPAPAPTPPNEALPVPPGPKRSNKTLFIVGGVILVVICLCIILCLMLGGTAFITVLREREPVSNVIDSFMTSMVEKDTESAYALFSTRAQRQIKISELDKMLEGNNYYLFDGYRSIEIGNLNVSKSFNTNQDMPQGTVATVDGTISYSNGFQGRFEAVLEKEGDVWPLHSINVTVPPDKFKPQSFEEQINSCLTFISSM